MLLKDHTIRGIIAGEITTIFRRWKRPGVKVGGTQMTQLGVVGIDAVDVVTEDDITELDATTAGFATKTELLEHLSFRDDDIYRIKVHWAGEDPRIALRENADLTDIDLFELIGKLGKLDKKGPWTSKFLQIIHEHPATYSGVLARKVGMEIAKFKPMVRKLKALGLTESLDVGYRLSPRGERILDDLRKTHGDQDSA